MSCIEEFEEEENEENVADGKCVGSPFTMNGNAIHERLSSPIEEEDEVEVATEEDDVDAAVVSRVPGSPSAERKSCPEPVLQAQLATRTAPRPHTVPMDAKLNLPYLTGYDKVMHMLEMPCESLAGGEPHLLDEEGEEYSYPYVATNSDPVASSPNSEGSEVDTGSEDEFGKHGHGSQREDSGQEEDRESDENEINDNVSDESGYSEDAVSHRKESQTSVASSRLIKPRVSDSDIASNNNNNESPCTKSNTKKLKSSDAVATNEESSKQTTPPSPLVIYDNLCFEI